MYKIKADTVRNYLIIELKGFFNENEIQNAASIVVAEAKKLKPGFTVINNIAEFKPVQQEFTRFLAEAQTGVMKLGPARVIRVVGNSLAKAQFNRIQKEANVGYEVYEVSTVEEAYKLIH